MEPKFIRCIALAAVLLQSARAYSNGPELQLPIFDEVDVNIEERDALYPITRYAGMGYNLLRGNPEGDFDIGGKDPGIQGTRWIFNLTYTMNKEGHYKGKTVAVPDQVEFQPRWTCASQSLTKAYSGQTSYQKELKRNVNFGISGVYALLIEFLCVIYNWYNVVL